MHTWWRGCKPEPTEGGPQPIERQGRLPLALPGAMTPHAQQVGTPIGEGRVKHMQQEGVGQRGQEQQLLPHLPILHSGTLEGQRAFADAPDAFDQAIPMQSGHQDGRATWRAGQARAPTGQAAGFGRAHHTPIGTGLTFGFFPNAAVPDHEDVRPSRPELADAGIGLRPQDGADVVSPPVGGMDRLLIRLVPAGACSRLSR